MLEKLVFYGVSPTYSAMIVRSVTFSLYSEKNKIIRDVFIKTGDFTLFLSDIQGIRLNVQTTQPGAFALDLTGLTTFFQRQNLFFSFGVAYFRVSIEIGSPVSFPVVRAKYVDRRFLPYRPYCNPPTFLSVTGWSVPLNTRTIDLTGDKVYVWTGLRQLAVKTLDVRDVLTPAGLISSYRTRQGTPGIRGYAEVKRKKDLKAEERLEFRLGSLSKWHPYQVSGLTCRILYPEEPSLLIGYGIREDEYRKE